MKKIMIFGHKNPDTDTICSALAYAALKVQMNLDVCAARLGNISNETQFVLDYLKIDAPELIHTTEGRDVILVDHNEFTQSADDIQKANIIEVIDHHRIANFTTSDPIYMNVQPVGCTATILYDIAIANDLVIDYQTAVLMISAIISDSLLFKSPTCTKKDVDACHKLNEIAKLDLEEYGLNMLKAGTNLDGFSHNELLNIDSKVFETAKAKYEVAQINTIDLDQFKKDYKSELLTEANKILADKHLDCYIILVTDIVASDSIAIVGGNVELFESSFNTKLIEDVAFLEGVVSRKKQIVPYL